MVRLNMIDYNGAKHIFVMDNCLHHPTFPINLFSTRCLVEKIVDINGNPDEEPESSLATQLTFIFGGLANFKKHFPHQYLVFLSFY
jgi:hypothetical protein